MLFVDDMRASVHPGQEAQWIPVPTHDPREAGDDDALTRAADRIAERVTGQLP